MSSHTPPARACRVKRWLARIWQTPLGKQNSHFAERYLAYVMTPVLIGVLTFIAMYYLGISHFPGYYKFDVLYHNRYALETALNFGFWLYVIEEWGNRLLPPRWSRRQRTVGGTCLLWTCGFFIAFVLQLTLIYQRIDLYAPKIMQFFDLYPLQRPSIMLRLAVFAAIWLITLNIRLVYDLLLQRLRRRHPHAGERAGMHQHDDGTASFTDPHPDTSASGRPIFISTGKYVTAVQPDLLAYITSEGHYCRFIMKTENKHNEIFTRIALKDVIAKLPPDDFVQIHRSHVVNKHFIERLKKSGRSYAVYLDGATSPLPISRHRWSAIRDRIELSRHVV